MTNSTNKFRGRTRSRAFSLIEVMIAVAVLSTGLLALAALNSAVISNSAYAKARSQALVVAQERLEQVRSSAGLDANGYETLATTAAANYAPIALGGAPTSAETFTVTTTVRRFVHERDAADCGGAANTPCFRQAAAGDAYDNTPEFKRAIVTVRWNDINGQAQTITLSDAFSAVTRQSTASVTDTPLAAGSATGSPSARIMKPTDPGIIPIAVGDGETAASNPKPVLAGRERGRTDEVRFDVLSYGLEGANDEIARLERRIENVVLGCRCNKSAPPSTGVNVVFAQPFQPAVWNGEQYFTAGKREITGQGWVDTAFTTQNLTLCQTCCLDHHDVAGEAAKVDPFRPAADFTGGDHNHYGDANNDGVFELAASGDDYFEACRLVRADGIFRVSPDPKIEQMNLLVTDNVASNTAGTAVPSPSILPRYQAFVKAFIEQLVLNGADPASDTAFTGQYSDVLVDPANITMQPIDPNRFLHNRALFIDKIEADARQAINDAIADCPGAAIDCALPATPFVSINATDLAQWGSEVGKDFISVSNLGRNQVYTNTQARVGNRGITDPIAAGVERAMATMQRSPSGLADIRAVDPHDANQSPYSNQLIADAQQFTVTSSVPSGGGKFFTSFVPPADNSFTLTSIGILWKSVSPVTSGNCTATTSTTVANNFECLITTAAALPRAIALELSGYNRSRTSTNPSNPCGGTAQPAFANVCINFKVAAATANGTPIDLTAPGVVTTGGTQGMPSETTTLQLGVVADQNAFQITYDVDPFATADTDPTTAAHEFAKPVVTNGRNGNACRNIAPACN